MYRYQLPGIYHPAPSGAPYQLFGYFSASMDHDSSKLHSSTSSSPLDRHRYRESTTSTTPVISCLVIYAVVLWSCTIQARRSTAAAAICHPRSHSDPTPYMGLEQYHLARAYDTQAPLCRAHHRIHMIRRRAWASGDRHATTVADSAAYGYACTRVLNLICTSTQYHIDCCCNVRVESR